MIGVERTERPTPAGRASRARMRKAEFTVRLAPRLSPWARAAAAKGMRLMVTG